MTDAVKSSLGSREREAHQVSDDDDGKQCRDDSDGHMDGRLAAQRHGVMVGQVRARCSRIGGHGRHEPQQREEHEPAHWEAATRGASPSPRSPRRSTRSHAPRRSPQRVWLETRGLTTDAVWKGTGRPSRRGNRRRIFVVALTFLGCVIAYTDRVNISVAAVAMQDRFAWSQTQKGFVLSALSERKRKPCQSICS